MCLRLGQAGDDMTFVKRDAQGHIIAVSPAPGLFLGFYAVVVIYAVLTVFTVYVLRRLASRHDVAAPYEGSPATPDDERAGVS